MSQYAKSIAAFIGLFAIVSKEYFGVEVTAETADAVVNGILALGTIYAVYAARNTPAPTV
jgi:hypothetical protein